MNEAHPLTPEQRLDAVVDQLARETPSGKPLIKVAQIGNIALRIACTESGDMLASVTYLDETATKKTFTFSSFEVGAWAPLTRDTGSEQFAELADLAEEATWADESNS